MAIELEALVEAPRLSGHAVAVLMVSGDDGPEALGPEPIGEIDPGFCRQRNFGAKRGETLSAPGSDGSLVVAVGLGERESLDSEVLRRGAASFVRSAWSSQTGVVGLRGVAKASGMVPSDAGQAIAEGALLGAYRFTEYKGDRTGDCRLEKIVLVGEEPKELDAGARRGALVARAVILARDLVNEPPGAMTPRDLVERAESMAGPAQLAVLVMDEGQILDEGLGGLAGVASGSSEPPRLIKLTYEPSTGPSRGTTDAPGRASRGGVALVGKGITFDSGGLSLKSAEAMVGQKTDMSGAAAVLATMSVLAELSVGTRVIGIIPTTENMPGPHAIKPGDVLKIRNGKTIEVLNTDAEGRLILADGLSLAVEEGPDAIVDLATLTGACVVALGRRIAGLMGNEAGLVERVQLAAASAGEDVWHLPLPLEYRSHIDSDVADMKNTGLQNQAGALAAGLLLAEFTGDVPWAHLDIAGPARSDSDEGYLRKGGTGFGVRTLVELLSNWSSDIDKG